MNYFFATLKPLCCVLCIFSCFLAGCDQKTQTDCIKIADESLTEWNGCDPESGENILLFPLAHAALPEKMYASNADTVYVDPERLDAVLSCFSERELLEAEAFKLHEKCGGIWKLVMPYRGLSKNDYPDFFKGEDDVVIIKSPYTGNDIKLCNVAAIKFKGTPLLLVPTL